jgi:hypothetical protein
MGAEEGKRRGVERVLRDGDEDAGVVGGADCGEQGVDARRGACGEEDAVWIGGEAISLYSRVA